MTDYTVRVYKTSDSPVEEEAKFHDIEGVISMIRGQDKRDPKPELLELWTDKQP